MLFRSQVVHGRTGLLFAPGDVGALTEHLETLRSDTLRSRLGAAAERRVRELFTLSTMIGGFTAQVERLLTVGANSAARS